MIFQDELAPSGPGDLQTGPRFEVDHSTVRLQDFIMGEDLDRGKHVSYWRTSAAEDVNASKDLILQGHLRHGLFFLHLAVEKTLKGLVVHATGEIPPKSHDLLRLADKAGVDVPPDRGALMSRIARYCLEGRYPDSWLAAPDPQTTRSLFEQAEELLEWLDRKF